MTRSGPVHGWFHYNRAMTPSRFALLMAVTLLAPVALASPPRGMGPPAMHGAPRAGGISLDEAVARVEQRFHARAVKAREHREGGRVVYRIRLLSEDGRVFEVSVDAATGQVE